MRKSFVIITLSMFVIIMGCQKKNNPVSPLMMPPTPSQTPFPISWTLIEKSEGWAPSSHSTRQNMVITDHNDWQQLWNSLHYFNIGSINPADPTPTPQPTPVAPDVDFNTEIVVAVFMGDFGSSGKSTKVIQVAHDNGLINVSIEEKYPGCDEFSPTIPQSPYYIIRVTKTGLPVNFLYEDEDADGDGYSNYDEYRAGTCYQDAASHP